MIRPDKVPVTVDVIIRLIDHFHKIVVIKRKNPPYGYALPGGFLKQGESLSQAAVLAAKEETGLDILLQEQFFAYSKPGRDSRGSVVSVCFIATAEGDPVADEDAAEVIKIRSNEPISMAFDHAQILKHYREWETLRHRPFAWE